MDNSPYSPPAAGPESDGAIGRWIKNHAISLVLLIAAIFTSYLAISTRLTRIEERVANLNTTVSAAQLANARVIDSLRIKTTANATAITKLEAVIEMRDTMLRRRRK